MADDDVSRYLRRLGVDREPPSVDALGRLHRAHVERVPYETTWIHMGERWSVDRAESLHRIAVNQRGGYCFHVNGAMSLVLESLGYDVTLHIGGVHGPDGPTEVAMDNHLVLIVHGLPTSQNPGGDWYLDAGLGDALHEMLPLVPGPHLQGPFEFGLDQTDVPFADWALRHHPLGSFTGMAFRSTPTDMDAFAARNIELSTSPESGFVKTVTAQLRDASGLDLLRCKVLRRIESSIVAEQTLDSRTDWFNALADTFQLPLTDTTTEQRDRLWTRVSATHDAWLATRSDG